ncbi:MAG: 3-oxoacyl-ACP synthase III, partial [Myxococcales bacterium]|nr:3-oxoacyl-ACP synthase III [Myxococcales bacterium]
MKFTDVAIAGLAYAEAPHRVPSTQFEDQLADTFARLEVRPDVLRSLAGIEARRWWDPGTKPSDAATLAARQVIDEAGVDPAKIGVLVNTSVCRDFLEPSTASIVHGNLGLPTTCMNFDLGNACLAFVNAIEMVGALIERRAIEYALIVDGEGSREIQEATLARMVKGEMSAHQFRKEFASLTLGSGGVAMLLTHRDNAPDGPRVVGGVSRAATEHARLCWGHATHMETETKKLLFAGVTLARQTWAVAQEELGWSDAVLDELVMHQVSQVHTATLCQTLGLTMSKALLTFPELGNVG